MGKLTAIKVKSLKEPGRYGDGDGLFLIVRSATSKSWVLRMQVLGKRRDFGLGSARHVSLAEARTSAAETRRLYKSGDDPVAVKKPALAASLAVFGFEDAARKFYEEQKDSWRNEKHKTEWISSLERYAFAVIGKTNVADIDAALILKVLLPIWLEVPETARRVKQRIGAVLDWAYANGLRESEAPMRAISKGLPKQPKRDNHLPSMPYAEVPAFMNLLAQSDSIGRLALQFAILTAARTGEVRKATWEQIELIDKIWTVPPDSMKTGEEHVVPLSAKALEILEVLSRVKGNMPDALLFPGQKTGRPLSDMTLTKVMRDLGQLTYTVHGFRSSFKNWVMEQTDHGDLVSEAALSHKIPNQVKAAYLRTKFLEKRRPLMDDWADFISTH